MLSTPDTIFIAGLSLPAHIGVPDEERRLPQSIEADIRLMAARSWQGIEDRLEGTIDYEAAALLCRETAIARPRQLLETLADDLATDLFDRFQSLERVEVELRKRILPGVHHVGVRCVRIRTREGLGDGV
jgi:dihydroneopterin aldolase